MLCAPEGEGGGAGGNPAPAPAPVPAPAPEPKPADKPKDPEPKPETPIDTVVRDVARIKKHIKLDEDAPVPVPKKKSGGLPIFSIFDKE
jgi:hypothetical protein